MEVEKFSYDNRIVKLFSIATLLWAVVGILVGIIISLKLIFPEFLGGVSFLQYGRLRPLHTNGIIFAFVGNGIFAGVYYSLQRLLKTRMWSDKLSQINFWGWQLIIVIAAITLPLGIQSGKEYAELEWWVDILIALIWVAFGVNMIGTIIIRRVRQMYVAIWFFIATFITVAILHVVNSFALPVSWTKSYSLFAGAQDGLVQWWYGHNAVAFFLTTPYLGLMYYFVPKAVNRPVYSYRLSIIHFWALIFIYIWAGPHHLLYNSLPDWAQTLGVIFSVMLIAPSWGGMLNGLLTMRGAWDKVRDNSTLKFFVVALTAYGMATFEGPMLSLKNVNIISHFTDWTIAHAHLGGIGWNGMFTFGMLYWMIPKLWKTKIYSEKLANMHFWIATLGILLWVVPIYWAGFEQGLMWREFKPDGTLAYTEFLDTVNMKMMFAVRSLGGVLFIIGALIGIYNLMKTAGVGSFENDEAAEAAPLVKQVVEKAKGHWHGALESKPVKFILLAAIAVSIGGLVQIIPVLVVKENIPRLASVKAYTPLELEGRDIYVREGCNACHSQMIRPVRFETERYGEYSKAGEFVYDRPFLWGSKRTGPDLAREGGKRSDAWHYKHFKNPGGSENGEDPISPGTLMPSFPWLINNDLYTGGIESKIAAFIWMDETSYPKGYEKEALADLEKQAEEVAARIVDGVELEKLTPEDKQAKVDQLKTKEVVALIAYLQRLGTDIREEVAETKE